MLDQKMWAILAIACAFLIALSSYTYGFWLRGRSLPPSRPPEPAAGVALRRAWEEADALRLQVIAMQARLAEANARERGTMQVFLERSMDMGRAEERAYQAERRLDELTQAADPPPMPEPDPPQPAAAEEPADRPIQARTFAQVLAETAPPG